MNKNLRNVLLYLGIPLVLIMAVLAVVWGTQREVSEKYSDIKAMVMNNEISEFELNLYSGELVYTLRADGQTYRYNVADASIFYNDVSASITTTKRATRPPG